MHPELTGRVGAHRQADQEQQRNHYPIASKRQIPQQEIQRDRRQRPRRTGRHRDQPATEPESHEAQWMPQQTRWHLAGQGHDVPLKCWYPVTADRYGAPSSR